MKMETTLHNEIEAWLAADIHGQLSERERDALHQHLVECKACRQLHQEEKIMHKLLEEKLATEKADPTFEQRMLSGFRRRISDNRGGLARFLVNALRSRVTQIAAAAVVLLALVQTGRVITQGRHGLERRTECDGTPSAWGDSGGNSIGKMSRKMH